MRYKQAIDGLTLFPPVIGGDDRQASVLCGLRSIMHRNPRFVLVHDVARPLASHALISRVIAALGRHEAAIPALPITDAVKRAQDHGDVTLAGETIDRAGLYTVQTPQGCHYARVLAAHEAQLGKNLPDDAAVIEQAGGAVCLVDGEPDNIKLTTQAEYPRMQMILDQRLETRAGMGYDVHRLVDHDTDTPESRRFIKLCGIKIPFAQHLAGHSDADVGLHALVDAMLGALGDGDIGTHFPPSDPQWKGADSERFLMHAYEKVVARKGYIVHLDLTIICEQPKISPYREAMKQHIAQRLKMPVHRISIKATTTEKLGFTGRGEGIAAQAVATLRLPKEEVYVS